MAFALAACTGGTPPGESPSSPPSVPTESETPDLPGVGAPLPDLAAPLSLAELGGFTGVARLEMGSNCTGTVVDTGVDDGPAYILTNGHCTGDVGRPPQSVTIGEDWFGQGFLLARQPHQDRAPQCPDGQRWSLVKDGPQRCHQRCSTGT